MTYHLRQAFLAMRGNLTAALSTLFTMTLTLVMLGFVVLLTLNVNRALGQLESQVEVAAFLNDGADVDGLLARIRGISQVTAAVVVPKAQVLSEMTRDYPYVKDAADLAGNPFPDTIRLRVQRVADTRPVAQQVGALSGVQDVEYGAGYVDQTVRTLNTVRAAAYVLVGLLLAGTLFNILNAVRVAMYARRAEISVMRLLGATRGFIRLPYLLEGVLLGLAAGLVAALLLYPGYRQLAARVAALVPSLPVLTDTVLIGEVLLGLAGLGVLVGLIGSWWASSRYMRELE